MNWHKTKTILIIFLICTNMFLLSTIITSMLSGTIITDDIVNSVVSVLKNNRIEIDPQIIPRKVGIAAILQVENVIETYEAFSERFLGDNITHFEKNIYKNEKGEINFYGDRFKFVPSTPLFGEEISKLNEENTKNIASAILEEYSLSEDNQLAELKTGETENILSITKDTDAKQFNSNINIAFTDEGVQRIEGSWFRNVGTQKEKLDLKNVTGVLIDYISLVNRPTTDEKIISLEFGYSILEDGIHHKEAYLSPCWKIKIEGGNEYILSAVEN